MLRRTWTVRFAKSTSAQRRPRSSPSRSPVNAPTRKIAASCSHDAARASDSTSSGVSTEKSPDRDTVTRSASSAGFDRDPLLALRPLQHAVQQHEDLLDRAARQPPLPQHPLAERVDVLGRDRRDRRRGAQARQQVQPDRVAVVAERRRRSLAIVLDVAQPLATGVLERHDRRAARPRRHAGRKPGSTPAGPPPRAASATPAPASDRHPPATRPRRERSAAPPASHAQDPARAGAGPRRHATARASAAGPASP